MGNLPDDDVDDASAMLHGFDVTVPSSARIWNYWVGGKDHFAADREAADKVVAAMPSLPLIAKAVRRFLIDIVRTLTVDHGIRQFLDIGTGLPTADNTHEVAQRAAPESRIVYVDNDPLVLAHAKALLVSAPEGKTDYVPADLRDTDEILSVAARTLDFGQPVAVMLLAILHFMPDADDPYRIVKQLLDPLPAGSFLVICHAADDIRSDQVANAKLRYNESGPAQMNPRNRTEIARFFAGLDLVGPGVVPVAEWLGEDDGDSPLAAYVGVARKPA
jgi:O-methyltransferase involved in polyketide biosynthesis